MTTGELQKKSKALNQNVESGLKPKSKPPDIKIVDDIEGRQMSAIHDASDARKSSDTESKTTNSVHPEPSSNRTKEITATKLHFRRTEKQSTRADELPNLGEQYQIIGVIGKGGMGTVYKVFDRRLEKLLAVKVLLAELADDQTALRRFEQEAEAAAQLEHSNLVSVYGYGKTESGAPYLVMDYLAGDSLASLVKTGSGLEPERSLRLFQQICEALLHAHDKGVIHRDIKPANVIVSTTESGIEIANVVDFGIAKILPVSNRETTNLTETRQVFGSPHYMSPEHCLGFKMDERSDIYSLGCLMYEVLTGNPPFPESDAIQVVIKHINEEAKPFPPKLTEDPLQRKLEGVVLKCLEKEQSDRYQTVREVLKDLELIQAGKTPAKFIRRKLVKPEYTTGQIGRAIFGTILILTYFGCSLGWLGLDNNLYLGLAMLLVSVAGAGMFSLTAVEQLRSLFRRKTTSNDWWNLFVLSSLITMCLSYAPHAFEVVASPLELTIFTNPSELLIDILSGISLVHLFSIGSVVVSLLGRILFGGTKNSLVFRVAFQYLLIGYASILMTMVAFPAQVSTFSEFLSHAVVLEHQTPATTEALLRLSLRLNPLNQSALFALVDRKLADGQIDEVDRLFTNYFAVETAPKRLAAAHFKRSETLEDGSWQQLNELSRAIKFYPRYDYYEHRAELHIQRGEFANAMKDFEEAIRSNPSSPTPYIGRAQIFAATSNFQIALAELSNIAELKTGWANMDVFFLRALLFEKLNRSNLAAHDFMTVVETAKAKVDLSPADAFKAAYSAKKINDVDSYRHYIEIANDGTSKNSFDREYRLMNLPLSWQ